METHREQCAKVQIYSTVRAHSTVQPEYEKKVGVPVRGAVELRGATPSQSISDQRED